MSPARARRGHHPRQGPLKVSRYAYLFRYPDGLTLAYSSLTGSLIELDGRSGRDVATALEEQVSGLESSTQRDALAEAGFLVDSDVNELNVVKEIWRKGQRKAGDAMLTILPTLSCNFRCPYCFERHSKGLMPEKVQDRLVTFTGRHLLPRSKEMSIDWFGGEPLVGLSVMESLTARFREACKASGLAAPSASVTTNGYLLDSAMYRTLMDLGVTSGQITLDGPCEIHDRRRPLAGGRPTFDRIVRNIQDAPEEFSLSVRINVDGGNMAHIFELIELLHKEGVIPRVTVYVGMVEGFGEECRSTGGVFLTSEEYARFKVGLNRRCESSDIPWTSIESPALAAYGYCIVDQPKGFVVQPDGKLLKCWAEAGNSDARPVADLLQEETWRRLFAKPRRDDCRRPKSPGSLTALSPLQSRDPFDDHECCECSLLPACMGACPTMRKRLRDKGVKRCPPLRYSLREDVRALFLRQKSSEPHATARLGP